VHESAHEWFGNNITTKDLADMWVHESFANYSETLFTESEYGKKAGEDYVVGSRKHIQNDIPIIGKYNVNEEGSGDMYYKGGNMIHTIRQLINDDERFRTILRGLNKDYYHQTVTTEQIEEYISEEAGINLTKVFDQYLRTAQVPILKYHIVKTPEKSAKLMYMWTNCNLGFDMPVKVKLDHGREVWLKPTMRYQSIDVDPTFTPNGIVDRNFYVTDLMMEPAED
jgi:aminopeptidase N